jgi:hypothetical protein
MHDRTRQFGGCGPILTTIERDSRMEITDVRADLAQNRRIRRAMDKVAGFVRGFSSGRSDMSVVTSAPRYGAKLRRSGTNYGRRHAAPMELEGPGGTRGYKHAAPDGAVLTDLVQCCMREFPARCAKLTHPGRSGGPEWPDSGQSPRGTGCAFNCQTTLGHALDTLLSTPGLALLTKSLCVGDPYSGS